jgi:hypothetical protein
MEHELNQNCVIHFSLKNKSCDDAFSENWTGGTDPGDPGNSRQLRSH